MRSRSPATARTACAMVMSGPVDRVVGGGAGPRPIRRREDGDVKLGRESHSARRVGGAGSHCQDPASGGKRKRTSASGHTSRAPISPLPPSHPQSTPQVIPRCGDKPYLYLSSLHRIPPPVNQSHPRSHPAMAALAPASSHASSPRVWLLHGCALRSAPGSPLRASQMTVADAGLPIDT